MRKFLVYSLLVIVISGTISGIFFKMIALSRIKEKDLSALDYCMQSDEYNDFIFIGGSRVRNHINPAIIDSVLGTRSYSVSIDGMGIVEGNLLLKEYLKNHPKPKIVFLNMDVNMFYTNGPIYNLTDYFSYLSDSLVYQCLSPYRLVYRSRLIQLYFRMQQVFGTTDWSKEQLILNPRKKEINFHPISTRISRGFIQNDVVWAQGSDEFLKYRVKVVCQEKGLDLLKNMIDYCHKDSVKVVFLYTPSYDGATEIATNNKEIRKKITAIASQYNVQLWNYGNMQICHSKKFFTDPVHLNKWGASIFSKQFAEDIKEKLYKSSPSTVDTVKL